MASATIDIAYNRLVRDVVSAFDEVQLKGGTVPSSKVSANLAAAIRSISAGVTVFGAIVVDFPAGSTCTCSNGSLTYTAGSTGGNWVFIVPVAGTWTVTATSGSDTASESVNITTQGQGARVELSFAYILYKPELELVEATSEWIKAKRKINGVNTYNYPTVTRYEDHLHITGNNGGGMFYHGTPVDLTYYRQLTLDGVLSNTNGNAWAILGVWNQLIYSTTIQDFIEGAFNTTAVAYAACERNNLNRRIITVDVSNLTGQHYIGFGVYLAAPTIEMYGLELTK